MVKTLIIALIVVVSSGCHGRRVEYINVPVPCPAPELPARPGLPELAPESSADDVAKGCLVAIESLGGYCLALETILYGYGSAPAPSFHQPGNP